MLDASLTLRDVGWLAVFVTVVVAGVFLIRALIHLGGALRVVKKLAKDNSEGIDKVIKDLPALTENVVNLTDIAADVADNLRNEQELVEAAIESVVDTIESVSDTARAINEDFLGGIRRLVKTIAALVGFITKKKPRGTVDQAPDVADDGYVPEGYNMGGPFAEDRGDMGDGCAADDGGAAGAKPARERRVRKARKRGASGSTRRKYADKGRNININIR